VKKLKLPTIKQAIEDLKPNDAFDWFLIFIALYFIYKAFFS
jgi:hypothetical protein